MIERKAPQATCRVLTFKEGLLSAIAHDLELEVTRFSVTWDPATLQVDARFDTASLKVLWAVRDGEPDAGALSSGDKGKIEAAIRDEVLASKRHPEARFRSTRANAEGDGFRIEGELMLQGVTRHLLARARREGERLRCDLELHQPDFGITPYRAAFGTLKVKPKVLVQLSVPA